MKMHNNALIFLWNGKTSSDEIVKKMANVLIESNVAMPEFLTVVYKDCNAIIESLAKDAIRTTNKTVSVAEKEVSVDEEIRIALAYIGEFFKLMLTEPSYTSFTMDLSVRLANIKSKTEDFRNLNEDELALLNAVRIIVANASIIRSSNKFYSLRKKYGIPETVIEIIQKIYHSLKL